MQKPQLRPAVSTRLLRNLQREVRACTSERSTSPPSSNIYAGSPPAAQRTPRGALWGIPAPKEAAASLGSLRSRERRELEFAGEFSFRSLQAKRALRSAAGCLRSFRDSAGSWVIPSAVRRHGGCFGQLRRPPAAVGRGTIVAVFDELHSSGESQGGGVGDFANAPAPASLMGEGQETSAA